MFRFAEPLLISLTEYIEAAYHIADSHLLTQRRTLLDSLGVTHQAPFLESTPRYQPGTRFKDIVGLHATAKAVFQLLSGPRDDGKRIFFDPPYSHQSRAIEEAVCKGRNLVIMTGTGSGKTESFLLPILGKMAIEATEAPKSFAQSAMRAMILYPMNALVNDQLGRLRAIFGDPRLVDHFEYLGHRPPRFARYTSRTPYAGVRSKLKDQKNLKEFGDFYVDAIKAARGDPGSERDNARTLIAELKERGKWPAKADLEAWYQGPKGKQWQDKNGDFIRAVTLPKDSELITRHEAQASAPDLMVTNYSMLEYMLMRPVERTIFDQTKDWLKTNPSQTFLLILDEAHLYRGAQGAEVGLLLRRLRDRLDISEDRFQIICATASFDSKVYAREFASKLTGVPAQSFTVIGGDLLQREFEAIGTSDEATILANIPMTNFYSSDAKTRVAAVKPFLDYAGVEEKPEDLDAALFKALEKWPTLSKLVNVTMLKAQAVESLGELIFPGVSPALSALALTNLIALATRARLHPEDPSLIPCRVHTFFRGLRGLWACMDANCTAIDVSLRGSVAGKLFSQPRDICDCGARVLELFTCRNCGTAYARGYCNDPEAPTSIWAEAGSELRTTGAVAEELKPLDILLSDPGSHDYAEAADFDLVTGQMNTGKASGRTRIVYLPPKRTSKPSATAAAPAADDHGIFHQCGVCQSKNTAGNPSNVQDHETKGDQPFQVLVSRQLQTQSTSRPASVFAPLGGRKVLTFSDSRQVAARLAPNLQMYSARDSLRPLIVRGWKRLSRVPGLSLRVSDIYFAVLLAAQELGVRLRPVLGQYENFGHYEALGKRVAEGLLESDTDLARECLDMRDAEPPMALLADIMSTLRDRSLGLEPLALASIIERKDRSGTAIKLPDVPGVTKAETHRLELMRAWLRDWRYAGFHLSMMGNNFYNHPNTKVRVGSRRASSTRFVSRLPSPEAKKIFKDKWLPELIKAFAEKQPPNYVLQGKMLTLQIDGAWVRCDACKSVHRPVGLLTFCMDCGRDALKTLDPETDEVFIKRKGFYRRGVIEALGSSPRIPMAIIAAEHTAQLNSAQKEEVFSKAEINELLFQDIQLPGGDDIASKQRSMSFQARPRWRSGSTSASFPASHCATCLRVGPTTSNGRAALGAGETQLRVSSRSADRIPMTSIFSANRTR